MSATVEIDKAGRLVVPKKLRDALRLVPGTRLAIHQHGAGIFLEPESKPRGLFMKDGILAYESGRPTPPESVTWVEQDREDRIQDAIAAGTQ